MENNILKEIASFPKPNLKKTSTIISYLNGKKFISENKTDETEVEVVIDAETPETTYLSRLSGYVVDIAVDKSIDQIIDRLYLSGDEAATDWNILSGLKITHVINVTTNVANKFEPVIVYKKIKIYDFPTQEIRAYFKETFEFIENALQNKQNSVLVHCNMGVSRSASIVIAYLLQKRVFETYKKAYDHVKMKRPKICPNNGFVQQLTRLEKKLDK